MTELLEYFRLDETSLVEEDEGTPEKPKKFMKLKGKFQQADLRNINGRIYPAEYLEREVEKLQPRIKAGDVIMLLDHPEPILDARGEPTGRIKPPKLRDAAALLTKLEFDKKDGAVYGESKVYHNSNGRDLQEMIRAGTSVGVSSRAGGTVKSGIYKGPYGEGEGDVVGPDLNLRTFDFVVGQSVPDANITHFQEQKRLEMTEKEKAEQTEKARLEAAAKLEAEGQKGKDAPKIDDKKQGGGDADDVSLTLDSFKSKFPKLFQEVRSMVADELESQFKTRVLDKLSEMAPEVAAAMQEGFGAPPPPSFGADAGQGEGVPCPHCKKMIPMDYIVQGMGGDGGQMEGDEDESTTECSDKKKGKPMTEAADDPRIKVLEEQLLSLKRDQNKTKVNAAVVEAIEKNPLLEPARATLLEAVDEVEVKKLIERESEKAIGYIRQASNMRQAGHGRVDLTESEDGDEMSPVQRERRRLAGF